jgi:hypothetical protein
MTSYKDVQMGIHLNHTKASCWFIRMEVLPRTRKFWEAVTKGTATSESKDTAWLAIKIDSSTSAAGSSFTAVTCGQYELFPDF